MLIIIDIIIDHQSHHDHHQSHHHNLHDHHHDDHQSHHDDHFRGLNESESWRVFKIHSYSRSQSSGSLLNFPVKLYHHHHWDRHHHPHGRPHGRRHHGPRTIWHLGQFST